MFVFVWVSLSTQRHTVQTNEHVTSLQIGRRWTSVSCISGRTRTSRWTADSGTSQWATANRAWRNRHERGGHACRCEFSRLPCIRRQRPSDKWLLWIIQWQRAAIKYLGPSYSTVQRMMCTQKCACKKKTWHKTHLSVFGFLCICMLFILVLVSSFWSFVRISQRNKMRKTKSEEIFQYYIFLVIFLRLGFLCIFFFVSFSSLVRWQYIISTVDRWSFWLILFDRFNVSYSSVLHLHFYQFYNSCCCSADLLNKLLENLPIHLSKFRIHFNTIHYYPEKLNGKKTTNTE